MTDIVPELIRLNLNTLVNRLDLFHPPRKFQLFWHLQNIAALQYALSNPKRIKVPKTRPGGCS